jgi:hypothetical protein
MSWALMPQQVICAVIAQLAFLAPNRLLILLIIPALILAYIFASLRKNRRGMRFTNTSLAALAQVPPDPDNPKAVPPARIVLLSDGKTQVGRPSDEAAAIFAPARSTTWQP